MNAPPALGYPPGVSLATDRQASPTAVNFGSNNPFRNRALSPSAGSATGSSASTRPERPRSTNPFLDDSEALSPQSAPGLTSGTTMISPSDKPDMTNHTRDLFESLSIKPAPTVTAVPAVPPPGTKPRPAEGASRVPSNRSKPPRERPPPGPAAGSRSKDPFDIFADPPRSSNAGAGGSGDKPTRRPRRNSESSVMDRASKLFDDDDDKRRRERRHRERDGRHRDGKHRSSRKNRQLDIIDKLDVTSIYGTGMFHHDGPFDACNPHRNRRGLRAAPMQAFPKNSSNMAIGGSGPVNRNIDLNLFHGRMEEGYNDFNTGIQRQPETVTFDPTSRDDPIHGPQSMGLGTSTFLDGAPASRSAIARRQSENEHQIAQAGGLQRKKSLAQRLRGRSGAGRITSPEAVVSSPSPGPAAPAAAPLDSSHSASSRSNERNPYFQDYDQEWDKKGAQIETRMETGGNRLRSASSPKQSTTLERKPTNERGYDDTKLNAGGGGFLNRMKSLRKPRPERRTSD
ncbi:hypothetical protein N7492_006687 [Penicillium capsulatum]|uniref:Pal1 cell morphology protein n=1 Tax=Penicillium capsulatum TaxID=69766 RepID=A0A9W9I1V3_9EURO|nr:hypothetical protein N7492_006687 [Penicillium capsulatum]KAJ6116523.1 hypothetical protein N7512_006248 [Penicillium capsulatum]